MIGEKAIAFVKRDLIVETSYKCAFLFELMSTLFPLFTFFFIGRMVGSPTETASRYGVAYFPFAIVGLAFTQYFILALRTFSTAIRRSQMAGCLEAMLSTGTGPGMVVVLSSLYAFSMKLLHVVVIALVGGLFLGVDFSQTNLLSAIVIMAVTVAAFSGFGIASAAMIIVLKKGDPIEWLFGSLNSLLGGALFPVSVMPEWLQKVAVCLPMTHALDAMRLAVFQGHSIMMLWKQIAVLGLMAAIMLPLSIWGFSKAVEAGRRSGGLMQY